MGKKTQKNPQNGESGGANKVQVELKVKNNLLIINCN